MKFLVIHYSLLIPIPEHIRMSYVQDAASAAAQRERESLDELRGYKDQLEVGSEAVSIVGLQKRGPRVFWHIFCRDEEPARFFL